MTYLNDIIIYLDLKEEHEKHVKWVLEKLYKENISVVIKKCEFHTKKTDFVEFIIKPGQINIDPKKIEVIVNWQDLKSVTNIKLFLGFCNYYRRFITKWLDKTELFTKMTKKNEL